MTSFCWTVTRGSQQDFTVIKVKCLILIGSFVLLSCQKHAVPADAAPTVRSAEEPPPAGSKDKMVFLIAQWDHRKTSNTHFIRYRLANRSTRTIYPENLDFWGVVEQWNGDRWVYVIGGAPGCRSGIRWNPLGSEMEREAPSYIRHPEILKRGRYRYRVTYSFDDWNIPNRTVLSASSEFKIEVSNRQTNAFYSGWD